MNDKARKQELVFRAIPLFVFFAVTVSFEGQAVHPWTEQENLGFKGPVRSVRTTVVRPNPDPRGETLHKLFVEGHPDWVVFDPAGRRTELVSSSRGEEILSVSKGVFGADGSKLCVDNAGEKRESREQRNLLPDGSREVTYFVNSKVDRREVSQIDEKGMRVSFRVYGSGGKLSSEELTLPDGDRWKIYGENGVVLSDIRTLNSQDESKVERWSYNSDGRLVWNLALSGDGDLLSHWYDVGVKPKLSSSYSLGICRPALCVSYNFDKAGSGQLEKIVEHVHGKGNLEPESEEHYNFDSVLDEKAEIRYTRDQHGNWTSRSVFVWDLRSNVPVEIERDTRSIEYYD